MTQALIDHVAVDVRIGLETTTIGRVAETICLLLDMHALLSTLLADLFDLFDLISLLEVALLDLFDPALILVLELIQLIHAHIHNVFFRTRVSDHHA
jgi:hypothetical protein